MTVSTIDETQRKAAKVSGFTYLLALITANFAEIYVPSQLVVHGDAAKTAANIAVKATGPTEPDKVSG